MISLKQITYALAVDEFRHFKKAAEACSVSQSALSSAIAELERLLAVQLFERSNKQVLITPIGIEFLERARQIKIQVDDLCLLAQKPKKPLSYPMSLGVIPTIGPYLLPITLPTVRQEYPDFQLSIAEEQSHVLVDKVRKGELDCAILALPFDTEGLHAFTFWEENFYLVAHQSDPLAKLKQISTGQMQQAQLLLLKDGHCLRGHALAACRLDAMETHVSLEGTSLYTLVQMVAGRMGVTLVPEMALASLITGNPELKAIPLDDPGPHRKIAFICRLNYAGVRNIELLMQLFREKLKESVHTDS